uniref:Uncharacterized protein n=1 Tax=Streptomyces sp. NBC_00093 TaxID=2975649 RepID=A0AAU2ABR1_9ACTN
MFKRTAVYVRGKTRSSKGRPAFAAFLAVTIAITLLQALLSLTPAQATSVNDCPGGAYSGEGSSSCPNLHNSDLVNQRAFPHALYRGDSRLPYEIFTHGFTARGSNDDLVSHIQGDRTNNSNFISTSGNLGLSETFARSQGVRNLDSAIAEPACSTGKMAIFAGIPWLGQLLLESCIGNVIRAETFVYVIDPMWARNALYVPDQIRGNANLYRQYVSQDEWAYVHRIPREAILGVRVYKMTARRDRGDTLDLRTLTFTYERFLANHYHTAARIDYDPGDDPIAHWNYYSDLHTPSLPVNQYNRGCSAADMCRGG